MKNDGKDFEIVFVKRFVRSMGYRRIRRPSDIETAEDTGDVRLMSRRVVGELRRLSETHGFLRGLVGEFGRLFGETELRPMYIVDRKVGF